METKTTRLLISGAILIVLTGDIFRGWFKAPTEQNNQVMRAFHSYSLGTATNSSYKNNKTNN